MDRSQERYKTVIDKNEFLFHIRWDGNTWVARAFRVDSLQIVALASSIYSSEKAALTLVKKIEK